MPTIEKNDQVLVSGANGYIAMWVVRHFLERGYRVRGTVRSKDKAKFLEEYFTKLGFGADKLEFAIVEDITKEGAFDEAVKGVDAIAHTASPFHANTVDDPSEFITPAVQGTLGILKSALSHAPKTLKRVVVTSSCAAVLNPSAVPARFDESNWNEESIKQTEELGAKAPVMTIYRASKTLAEKAAWKFWDEHKGQVGWDLSVINPPFVFGPPIHDLKSISQLNTSLHFWYDAVVNGDNEPAKSKEHLATTNSWVDVRDTSLAHVLALEKPEAGGERIITSAGGFSWQEFIEAGQSLATNPLPNHTLAKGYPELVSLPEDQRSYNVLYNKAKENKILGIKFHTKEETVKDTLAEFAKRGW